MTNPSSRSCTTYKHNRKKNLACSKLFSTNLDLTNENCDCRRRCEAVDYRVGYKVDDKPYKTQLNNNAVVEILSQLHSRDIVIRQKLYHHRHKTLHSSRETFVNTIFKISNNRSRRVIYLIQPTSVNNYYI